MANVVLYMLIIFSGGGSTTTTVAGYFESQQLCLKNKNAIHAAADGWRVKAECVKLEGVTKLPS